jgi:hypothetical protein
VDDIGVQLRLVAYEFNEARHLAFGNVHIHCLNSLHALGRGGVEDFPESPATSVDLSLLFPSSR